jgi:hypothetical protein
MADITIDGKKYDASEMNEDQKNLVQKLAQIDQSKKNLQSQLLDLDILADHYIKKFKDIADKE